MSRVLVVGDVHAPVEHPGYFSFIKDIYDSWDCNRVHFIGDLVDWHGISFHLQHPESPGVRDEYEQAKWEVTKWCAYFPKATVSIGNHDERVIRLAETVGIPASFLRSYSDIWNTPKWSWEYETIIDGVYYFHGTGHSGVHPAYNAMTTMCMSVCMGHVHHAGGIKWKVNPITRIFGMDVGSGIDDQAYAMAYNRHSKKKSVLSCGVVIDGHPYHEMMPMGEGEKYHRSRFKSRFVR